MKRNIKNYLLPLSLLVVAIYLFVSAPSDLPDKKNGAGHQIPVEAMFRMLAEENAAIRKLYTAEIVGPAQLAGLKFSEDWKQEGVEAGPLPALLLRETSNRLQIRAPELGLFLGSDYPIVKANLFKDEQMKYYQKVKSTRQPVFFVDPTSQRQTAMFPDLASAKPCVSCHNDHGKTPKKDWILDEVMGATTWSYGQSTVSPEEILTNLNHLRASAYDAYGSYLKRAESFKGKKPEIGDKWPVEGLFLPSVAAFKKVVEARNSARTIEALMLAVNPAKAASGSTAGGI